MLHYWFLPRLPLWKYAAAVIAALSLASIACGQDVQEQAPLTAGKDGTLIYTAAANGDRIPDFSYAGYMAGEKVLPDVPVRVLVRAQEGDATARIQAALDYVAALPGDADGIRGAVLLEKGVYQLSGSLEIKASGVVLRGSGMDSNGTVLVGAGLSRETLIRIAGKNDAQLDSPVSVTTAYVPVNAQELELEPSHAIRKGDRVMVRRPATEKWIKSLGMAEFGGETGWLGWKPGERDIVWDRRVIAVEGNTIKLDAPLTTALDTAYGGGTVSAYSWPGRIQQTGVENLRCRSTFAGSNLKDEAHRWMAITLENVRDAWVRQVVFEHFAGSAVAVYETGSRITVEDCISLAPVSEIGGFRRNTFFTAGQQTLFQRLYAEGGYHDFAAGFMAAGPNAFVECKSFRPHSFSGAIDSWASGLLLDNVNVDGEALSFQNRGQDGQGAGWTAANSVMWQCAAAKVLCYSPPGAQNWAFGIWAAFAGDAYWGNVNDHVEPRSLYYAQLGARLGDSVLKRSQLLPLEFGSTSSPTVEQAAALAEAASKPLPLLRNWIGQANDRNPIPVEITGLKTIEQLAGWNTAPAHPAAAGQTAGEQPAGGQTAGPQPAPLIVKNGWLTQGNSVLTGQRHDVRWWRGDPRPHGAREAGMHITRYVPGRRGRGYTDDIAVVTDSMKAHNIVALEHNYGLWYDRRRDDHERVRRMNGDVWAPFYELPFARSGQDTAWDGLSKYDLSRYNPWYWSRLSQFAGLAAQKQLLLIHKQYFQHNILEAGAHWADFPWRSANNINNTGFPEPPPYAGDKRIFMARQFYDTTHAGRRQLHRAYIRKCLENFSGNGNVLQLTGAEFTGPLHFMQFWLNTVQEWEAETGSNSLTGLSATKDVQDAILQDAVHSAAVEVIDIRYWHYRADGSLYAPEGGQSLAPRQHARLVAPGKESARQVYRAVSEYRERYPEKAVIYSAGGGNEYPWAVFMAGGSLAAIPAVKVPGFLEAAAGMHPAAAGDTGGDKGTGNANAGSWVLQNDKGERIIYALPGEVLNLGKASGDLRVYRIDPATGKPMQGPASIAAGQVIEIENTGSGPVVFWLSLRQDKEKEVYLFSSFKEPATDGLYLLYSHDGYNWERLGGPYIKPGVGDSLMRDPSIVRGPDGIFHMVWTTAWRGDKGFGYASSRDLANWSEQRFIPVMEHEPAAVNVWAPELYYDQEKKVFIIIWASTVPHRFPRGIEDEENNHRMYYTTTTDFKTFAPAELFLDPGFSVIDAVIVRRAPEDYALVLKDNTRPERNLKVAFASSPLGTYKDISAPFTGKLTEGPTVLRLENQWLIYFDSYGQQSYSAVKTADFKTFTDITEEIRVPSGHKHGTIFKASEELLNKLIEK